MAFTIANSGKKDKVLKRIHQYCQYCRTPDNKPMRHFSFFVSVPRKQHLVWKESIEKAINLSIPDVSWHACLKANTLRVGFEHLITNFNGEYSKEYPQFIEHAGEIGVRSDSQISSTDRRARTEITHRNRIEQRIYQEKL